MSETVWKILHVQPCRLALVIILVAQIGNASLSRCPLSLVSTQALLISHGASSAKLLFLLESRGSHRDCQPCVYNASEEWLGAAYAQDELTIQANAPSLDPLPNCPIHNLPLNSFQVELEFLVLERRQPSSQPDCLPKSCSCADAIFSTQEVIAW